MNRLLTLLLVLGCCHAQAQYYFNESFEAPSDYYRNNFTIDTVHYPHNKWQIGAPHKAVFDSALSLPNAIVTDTINTYPPNDTSVFYIYSAGISSSFISVSLEFVYKLDIDTLSIAKVEISGDSGLNWINPITEDTTYHFVWGGPKPRLDTSNDNWQHFLLDVHIWSDSYPGGPAVFPHYRTSDTLLYRFTFTSGSDMVTKDGWIMDNFTLMHGSAEGAVGSSPITNAPDIFPNPSTGKIYFNTRDSYSGTELVKVYNMNGQEVYTAPLPASKCMTLPLADGVYILKYFGNNGTTATKRIVLSR